MTPPYGPDVLAPVSLPVIPVALDERGLGGATARTVMPEFVERTVTCFPARLAAADP
jgi:hypothetical protein